MRQKITYLSSCIFALLLSLSLIPGTVAKAETTPAPSPSVTQEPTAVPEPQPTPVCSVGGNAYLSVNEAVEAIKTSGVAGTIQLIADGNMTTAIVLEKADVTLDLAGHVLTYTGTASSTAISVKESGVLHITDSKSAGKIQNTTDTTATISVDGGAVIVESGAIYNQGKGTNTNAAVQLTSGILTINGGWIEGNYPVYADVEKKELLDKSKIEIKSGVLQGYYGALISSDLLTTITGGTFISTNDKITPDAAGTEYQNAGLLIKYNTVETVKLAITGGTFTGHYCGIGWRYKSYSTDAQAADTNPTGIKNACIANTYGIYNKDTQAVATKFTTGKQAMATEQAVVVTIKQSKLTFNAAGGVVNTPNMIITYGSPYGKLPVPTRTGYTFLGWYTKKTGGTIVNADRVVTVLKAQTVYAHWEAKKTKITLNPNGGKVKTTKITVSFDLQYGTLPIPTRTGYTFLGWFTKKTGGVEIKSTTTVSLVVAKTLYAHWSPVKRTVTFNANGGTKLSFKKLTLKYNQVLGAVPTVQRKGYVFLGWYTTKTGGSKVTAASKSKWAENGTVYAHWKKVKVGIPSVKSIKCKSRKVTIKLNKASGAAGYQICIATNAKFTKGKKTYTVKTTSKKTSKLKKKKYYVRVRAYEYDSMNKKVYGAWSKAKTKTVK